jgi:TetR/AcrR family transcriptional regulator
VDNNRERIEACALRLFAARGYEAVGVQEIVDEAGITKPTLYHYFGSKQGLLETIFREHFQQMDHSVAAAADYQGDLPGTLLNLVRAYFKFAREHPTFYRLQLSAWFAPHGSEEFKVVNRLYLEQYQRVEQVFRSAVRNHGNMKGRHRAYAATFIGMINTYIGMAMNGYAELDEDLVQQAVRQFQYGIYS